MPLILPGNVATATASTGYNVANSCRFNDDDSAYLSRTQTSGSTTKFTYSAWMKRNKLGSAQDFLDVYDDNNNRFGFFWSDDDQIDMYNKISGSVNFQKITTARYRDISAWYNVIIAADTTLATAEDRIKLWVNGVRVTSFGTNTNPGSSDNLSIHSSDDTQKIGAYGTSGSDYDGYMAEVVWIDGTTYANTDFGEFDEDSPTIWKPKDVSGLTFGSNGFHLDFEDSSALGNDVSGENNDFSVTNLAATDQTTDTCTNNFATLNPLVPINNSTFSEGNCKVVTGSSEYSYDVSTIGVSAGKWYVEAKYGGSSDDATFGIAGRTATDTTHELGHYNDTWSYYTGTGASNVRNNNSNSSYGNTYAADDIIGLALDLTNNKLYFSKNGTWQNSGDPTSGSTGTGAISITAASGVTDGVYYIGIGDFDGGASVTWEINFGTPSFSISSGNADDNGYGNFEYDVPAGYLALCTKNLGSDGG